MIELLRRICVFVFLVVEEAPTLGGAREGLLGLVFASGISKASVVAKMLGDVRRGRFQTSCWSTRGSTAMLGKLSEGIYRKLVSRFAV